MNNSACSLDIGLTHMHNTDQNRLTTEQKGCLEEL